MILRGKWPIPDGTGALGCIETAIDTIPSAGVTVVYVQQAVLNQNGQVCLPARMGLNCTPAPYIFGTNDPRFRENTLALHQQPHLENTYALLWSILSSFSGYIRTGLL